MKKILLVLYLISSISLLPNAINAFAWGVGIEAFTIPIGWLILLSATFVTLAKLEVAIFLGLFASILLWLQLVHEIGWFLLFEPQNSILYAILLLPGLLLIACFCTSLYCLVMKKLSTKWSLFVSLSSSILLVASIPFIFANRVYSQNHFTEFELRIDNSDQAMTMTIKAQPSDTRVIRVLIKAKDVIEYVRDSADRAADTPYISNAYFKVYCHFNKLQSIELESLNEWKPQSKLVWSVEEINGDMSFLTPY